MVVPIYRATKALDKLPKGYDWHLKDSDRGRSSRWYDIQVYRKRWWQWKMHLIEDTSSWGPMDEELWAIRVEIMCEEIKAGR